MQSEWLCKKLVPNSEDEKIWYAEVKDLLEKKTYHVYADVFVLAAGAILTPQILHNSDIQPSALGRYLCEQPMAFCQIVLKQEHLDKIRDLPEWKERVDQHKKKNPRDPIPIPLNDPTPQV